MGASRWRCMVQLTGINGERFSMNADHILSVEDKGDTILVCSNGKRIRVLETWSAVVRKINDLINKSDEEAAEAAKDPAPAVDDPKRPAPRKKKAAFSETQWFMAGAQKNVETLEAQSDTAEYAHDDSISEETRREYTLRKVDGLIRKDGGEDE